MSNNKTRKQAANTKAALLGAFKSLQRNVANKPNLYPGVIAAYGPRALPSPMYSNSNSSRASPAPEYNLSQASPFPEYNSNVSLSSLNVPAYAFEPISPNVLFRRNNKNNSNTAKKSIIKQRHYKGVNNRGKSMSKKRNNIRTARLAAARLNYGYNNNNNTRNKINKALKKLKPKSN